MKQRKVFCKDCWHLMNNDKYGYMCTHPNNIVRKSLGEDSWFEPAPYSVSYNYLPRKLNYDNRCKWFTEKG